VQRDLQSSPRSKREAGYRGGAEALQDAKMRGKESQKSPTASLTVATRNE